MRLIFIRHGDPDYEHDTVTEKGKREIELLADKLEKEEITAFYLSPKGRAQKTAQATLSRLGRAGTSLNWLREFTVPVRMPDTGEEHLIWDFLPSFMERYPQLYSAEEWMSVPFIADSDVPRAYEEVCGGIDELLASYGYRRKGAFYCAEKPNRETLVFFCHFGITCIYTEEREKGIAAFRCAAYGDISHLYVAKEPPSFSARFCETFDNAEERH